MAETWDDYSKRSEERPAGEPSEVERRGVDIPRSRARRAEFTKPQVPTGFRSTRRTSKALKSARRAVKSHKWRTELEDLFATLSSRTVGTLTIAGLVVAAAVISVLVLVTFATTINGIARWNARRAAAHEATPAAREERARENLLVIGVENGKARGFLAMRVDPKEHRAFGFAIPDAALMEVPGRGFERVGDSYDAGPDVSIATISNYLSVPFDRFIVMSYSSYQQALTQQRVDGLLPAATQSNLDAGAKRRLSSDIDRIRKEDVAFAPLPGKPVTVGSETYYEPQRTQVADLLKSWWGVTMTDDTRTRRLVIYNGAGVPGIAGVASQQLIKQGFRVVTTGNADRFNYAQTRIIVQHGSPTDGQAVADVLKVGKISQQPSDQEIADIIVIIGKDYKPAARR